MMTRTRAGALIVAGAALAACLDDSITGTRALSFSMTASAVAADVAEEITFTYEAEGTQLRWIIVDYGDQLADTVNTSGNVLEASGLLTHAYESAGDFIVSGKAENYTGVQAQEINVTINQPLAANAGRGVGKVP